MDVYVCIQSSEALSGQLVDTLIHALIFPTPRRKRSRTDEMNDEWRRDALRISSRGEGFKPTT